MDKKSQCSLCQNGEGGPCAAALERIYAIQGTKKKVDSDVITTGCPWYINSAEHNYCFWKFIKDVDESISDKDICDLLLIDQQTLEATLNSAIAKLKDLKDTPELQEFREILLDKINSMDSDNTVYLPDEFLFIASEAPEEERDPEADLFQDEKKKKRKGFGMPMHRDGKKVDLYGIYSKKKKEELIQEKLKKHEKKDNQKG
ncbi:MAG: hypothetical protein QXL01_00250 [Thermoplasmatales archaeon]